MSVRVDRNGMHGYKIISTTSANKGPWSCIHMIDAVNFTTLTDALGGVVGDTGETIATFTFPSGFELYGNFSTFTLKSGRVVAYYAEDKS